MLWITIGERNTVMKRKQKAVMKPRTLGNSNYEAQIIFSSDLSRGKSWPGTPLSFSPLSWSFILVSIARALLSDFSTDSNEGRTEDKLRYFFLLQNSLQEAQEAWQFSKAQRRRFLGTLTWDSPLNCHPIHPHLREELSN